MQNLSTTHKIIGLKKWLFPSLVGISLIGWYWTSTRIANSLYDEFMAAAFVLACVIFLRSAESASKQGAKYRRDFEATPGSLVELYDEPQQTQFIDDHLAPSEAKALVASLIDSHINFYKLQYLNDCVTDKVESTTNLDNRIDELLIKKNRFKGLIAKSQQLGYRISIKGAIELKLVK